MWKFLLIATVLCTHSVLSAGIFSWTDASGNVVYGDSPPDTVVSKPVAPPKLTVLEGFANRYEDQNTSGRSSASMSSQRVTRSVRSVKRKEVNPYTTLKIIAPKAGQGIRANDGDASVALSMTPKLRGGDKVIIHLNGQQHSIVRSSVANLSNLDRGEHKLSVEIQNAAGESLVKSTVINFNILKNSVITNKKKPYNPYEEEPSQ